MQANRKYWRIDGAAARKYSYSPCSYSVAAGKRHEEHPRSRLPWHWPRHCVGRRVQQAGSNQKGIIGRQKTVTFTKQNMVQTLGGFGPQFYSRYGFGSIAREWIIDGASPTCVGEQHCKIKVISARILSHGTRVLEIALNFYVSRCKSI